MQGKQTQKTAKAKWPSGIPNIIGNEAAERFSYYGMRTILVVFMTKYLLNSAGQPAFMNEAQATEWYHWFVGSVYFFPLFGALIADIFWGKYKTIMSLSIVYCLGHLSLAFMDIPLFAQMLEPKVWLGIGLGLIAVGSGGIKPCVSAHVGDQFTEENRGLLSRIYSIFYFSINFGAFFSSLLTPIFLQKFGPAVAFGIPGALMLVATYVFWLGRHKFIAIPAVSQRMEKEMGTWQGEKVFGAVAKMVLLVALPVVFWQRDVLFSTANGYSTAGISGGLVMVAVALLFYLFKDVKAYHFEALKQYGREVFSPRGLKALLGLGVLYIFIAFFWALFDQTGSSWVLQADKMDRMVDLRFAFLQMDWLKFELLPSQIQAVNPILIMLFIPMFSFGVYPFASKFVKVTPLRKVGVGFFITGLSFAIIAYVEQMIQAGQTPSIMWQFLAYVIITAAEVLISITALEYSYTQAPNAMKSVIMGVYLLSVTLGNFITAGVNNMIQNADGTVALAGPAYFWFFTGLVMVAGVLFIGAAMLYKEETYIQERTA